jgi:hypothetical protein
MQSLTMSLLSAKDIGGSMLELRVTEEPDDESPRVKESKGLLRRAFSSKRRKKKKEFGGNVSPRGSSLRVSPITPPPCSCLLAAPFPGGYTQGDTSPSGSSNYLNFPGVYLNAPGSPGSYGNTLGRYETQNRIKSYLV